MSFENKQMKTTIQNLKKLLQKMNTLLHSWNKRTIDLIITKEFTDKLQKKISSLELSTKNNSEIDSDERGITI